jgi:hypothetical protein
MWQTAPPRMPILHPDSEGAKAAGVRQGNCLG